MLHVWFRGQQSPLAVWHLDERRWHLVDNWQQLYDIYGIHGTQAISLYFPTRHLLQVDTPLTSSQIKQLGVSGQQYFFEELFLGSVETLATRSFSTNDAQRVFALSASDIESWQQSAALVGLSIAAMLPDFLLLPMSNIMSGEQAVFYQDEATILLRQADNQALAVSYLPLMLAKFPELSEICVLPPISSPLEDIGNDPIFDPLFIAPSTKALFDQHNLQLSELLSYPEPVPYPERHALNFFTKANKAVLSPYLKTALMVALAAWVLQFATNGIQWYRYHEAAAATQSATAAQYQSWFPNEPLNARTQLQTQLAPKLRQDHSESSVALTLLSQVSPLIKAASISAQALIFEPDALKMTLIAPDKASLDRLVASVSAQGLTANLEAVNNTDQGGVTGNIRISSDSNNASASAL